MINRVILRGYVADYPFIRATEGGLFARLRMVTIEDIIIHKTRVVRRHTEWHTVSLWGDNAHIADQEIKIGSAIEIEGALRTREWEDKDRIKRRTTNISATKLTLLDTIEGYEIPDYITKLMNNRSTPTPPSKKLEVKSPAEDPDELPF